MRIDGYSIMKCEGLKEAGVPALPEISDTVREDAEKELLTERFEELRTELGEKVTAYTTIESLAADLAMQSGKTSPVLTTAQMIALELGSLEADDLEYINEHIEEGQISELLQGRDFMGRQLLYVLQNEREIPSRVPALAEIETDVTDAFKTAKARELMKQTAETFYAQAKDFAVMQTTADAQAREITTTTLFTRMEPPRTLPGGAWADFDRDSLVAKQGEIRLTHDGEEPEDATHYVVWHMRELETPDEAAFKEALPELQGALVLSKQLSYLEEWLQDHRRAMKWEITSTEEK